MKIETSKGQEFKARIICASLRKTDQCFVEIYDKRPLHEIIPDFDGLTTIKKTDESRNSRAVYEMFEGFTKLVGIRKIEEYGTVRITLERGA